MVNRKWSRAGRPDVHRRPSHCLFPKLLVKILLVKTSSMGDVIHNLPVVADILAARPDSDIDWVVEDIFAQIPKLHSRVRRVLPVAIRRWRASWWQGQVRAEIRAFLAQLKAESYDAVIDTQGLWKSAILARCAHGPRSGLDRRSSREPVALFYQRTFTVPWSLHAVQRNRTLVSQVLGCRLREPPDYGIAAPPASFAWATSRPYAVLVHATSARTKLWPDEHWIELGRHLERESVRPVLPWGNGAERERAERISASLAEAVVPPALSIADAASLLAGAHACIGVDTGLTHLGGALKVPTVGIYVSTDPAATGLYGCARALNLGGVGKPPTVEQVRVALEQLLSS